MPANNTISDQKVRNYVAYNILYVRKHLDMDRMYSLGILYSLENYLTFHSRDDETTYQALAIINNFRHKISIGDCESLSSAMIMDMITKLDSEVKH
tara:strand:+ start:20 stop:307 length:288 start_codon:yes stop_codon:yes gene_type:complete